MHAACLSAVLASLQKPDRRLAELHFKIGLTLQFLQKPEDALKEIEAAIEICKKSTNTNDGAEKVKTYASRQCRLLG